MTKKQRGKIKKKFLEALADRSIGGIVTEAIKRVDVGRSTIYNWRDKDEKFAADWDTIVDEQNERLADEAEFKLRQKVLEGNVTAIIFTLKSRRPERWHERHEHTGKGGGPVRHRHEAPTLEKLLKEMAKKRLDDKK